MKNFIIGLLFLCGFYACSSGKENISEVDCAQYVNPFIGNADNGHTFPGACAPFGMIQASPVGMLRGVIVPDSIMKMTRYSDLRRII